jgi:hypothetical protein
MAAIGSCLLCPGGIEAGKVAIGFGVSRAANSLTILNDGRTAARLPGGLRFRVGLRGGAARMTPLPLTLKSVDWLGVSGFPAAIAAALSAAAADAALAALAASAACPWSIENDDWADAVEMVAATMRNTPRMVRTAKTPPRTATNCNAGSDRALSPSPLLFERC